MASTPTPFHYPSRRERQSLPLRPHPSPSPPFWEDHARPSSPPLPPVPTTPAASTPLCAACHDFWAEERQLGFRYPHVRLRETLWRGLGGGCGFCGLVAGRVGEGGGEEVGLQLEVRAAGEGEYVVEGRFRGEGDGLGFKAFCLGLKRVADSALAGAQTGAARCIEGRLEPRALVQKWIRQCSTTHKACRGESAAEGFLPRRLLDVESARDGTMRLVDSDEIHKTENAYVIVACGEDSAGSLDLKNAVKVAEWCEVKYSWIESLCVRSDLERGSETEKFDRNEVFRNAFLTVSTTTASQISDRLPPGRSVQPVRPVLLHCPWLQQGGKSENPKNAPESQLYQCHFNSVFKDNIENPLCQRRGPALRERMLSARVLHFGAQQLCWECRELTACEEYPDGIPECFNSGVGLQLRDLPGANVDIWNKLVTTHPRSYFRSSTEMEVVFLDIAEVFNRKLNDEYVAGLWRGYLPFQLCWAVSGAAEDDDDKTGDSGSPLLPTWSWLSMKRSVFWRMSPEQLDCSSPNSRLVKLLDVSNPSLQTTKSDPARRAEITVNGLVHPGILEPRNTTNAPNGNCSVRLDGLPRLRKPLIGFLDQTESLGAENVVLLPLIMDKYSLNVGGLILSLEIKNEIEMNVFERSLPKYRRLGYFEGAQHIKELVDDRIDRKSGGPFAKGGENLVFTRAKWSTCTLI
ncbi:hypothetical protein MMC13_001958 [Lambiella insularis]|nr:hypothetical protein [Lambiella insularis]